MKRIISIILSVSMIASVSSVVFAGDTIQPRYDNTAYIYYCNGKGMGKEEIDCTKEAQTVYNYSEKWGYFPESYENPSLKQFTDGRINSIITLFAGHGRVDRVNTGNSNGINIGGTISGYKDISNLKLNSTELSVLAACESDAVARKMVKNGQDGKICVLCWKGSPLTPLVTKYVEYFFKGLDQGKTYKGAKDYARNFVKEDTGGKIDYNNDIYTDTLYGTENNTITKLDYRSSTDDQTNSHFDWFYTGAPNEYPINEDIPHHMHSEDYDSIIKYIKENINSEFDISDYVVHDYYGDTDYEDLTFFYKVGDIRSDFGYNVYIENDKVFLIKEIGTPISSKERGLITLSEPLTEQELFDMAIENDNIVGRTEDEVVEQKMYKWFDSSKKQVKYTVETVYMHIIDGEEMGKYAIGFEYFQ